MCVCVCVLIRDDSTCFQVVAASPSGLKYKQVPVFTLHTTTLHTRGHESGGELVSGSKDGTIKFWSLDLTGPKRTLQLPATPLERADPSARPDAVRSIDSRGEWCV